jgi:hypothetical protein
VLTHHRYSPLRSPGGLRTGAWWRCYPDEWNTPKKTDKPMKQAFLMTLCLAAMFATNA